MDEAGTSEERRSTPDARGPDLSLEVARARAEQALFDRDVAPPKLGRYTLLGTLGRGGMGVVHAAYDPELDRKIAIKVLHPSQAEQTRLVREAKALAKLKHPNVVAVYDVGTIAAGDAVFVAMEHVEGPTLTAWLRERPRSWREVLPVLVQAARGLAAAHAAGLVHRDFKPDNVMLDPDDRVRVMDFGLARIESADQTFSASQSAPMRVGSSVTETGSIVGTPAFMAPEQFLGRDVDARSDQFSYCIAAWVALYDDRPYRGETPAALATAVTEGHLQNAPPDRRIPAWLHAVIRRGLDSDRERRWPSMQALILALERGETRARRRRIAYGGVAAVTVVAGILGARAWDEARRASACERRGADAVAVWDDAGRAATRDAIEATGVAQAKATAERAIPWLDEYATALQDATTTACRSIDVDDVWDPDTAAAAQWCLEERRLAFEGLVAVLGEGDAGAVNGAIDAAAGLPAPAPCLRPSDLARMPVPDSSARAGVQEVRIQLSRAASLRNAGRFAESLPLTQAAVEAADTTGWAPIAAAARFRLGHEFISAGKLGEAEAALEEAYFQAASAAAPEVAADAALSLTQLVGDELERHTEGLRWGRLAERELAGTSDDGPRAAALLDYRAIVLEAAGEYEEALELERQALALREKTFGDRHPAVATSFAHLGAIQSSQGQYEDAASSTARALALRREAYGEIHSSVADSLNNLGNQLGHLGRLAEAVETKLEGARVLEQVYGPDHTEVAVMLSNAANTYHAMGDNQRAKEMILRSLDIVRAAYGPEHPIVGRRWGNLGNAYSHLGDYDAARDAYRRSLQILRAAHGEAHLEVAMAEYNLANLAYDLNDYREAQAGFERTARIMESVVGPEHPQLAATFSALGNTHAEMGEHEVAHGYHLRALAIQEKTLGPDHPDVAYTLVGIAATARQWGRPAEALAAAERAAAIFERSGNASREVARARYQAAQALWELGEPQRARAEAERSRDDFSRDGLADEAASVQRWIDER